MAAQMAAVGGGGGVVEVEAPLAQVQDWSWGDLNNFIKDICNVIKAR